MIEAKKKRLRRRNIFIFFMLVIPVANFVLKQGLNLNMFVMAFNDYTLGANNPQFVGWENFKGIFRLFDSSNVYSEWYAVRNSLMIGELIVFVNAPISLAFAYLLYSKLPGYKWMRVVLYFPTVISAVVKVLIFKSFMLSGPMDSIYSALGIFDKLPNEGWLGPNNAWSTIMIFSIWTGFSSNMMFFLSAMNRVPGELVEAAKLDGANKPRLFFSIILPLISTTVCTILTITLASMFSWCMPSLLFMGNDSGVNYTGTFGLSVLHYTSAKVYGVAAAYGILLTFIGAPITLGIRALGNKLEKNVEF